MRVTIWIAVVLLTLSTTDVAHASCGYATTMQDELDCQAGKLDDARRAQQELEAIASQRRLWPTPPATGVPSMSDYLLDRREGIARQDLDNALRR